MVGAAHWGHNFPRSIGHGISLRSLRGSLLARSALDWWRRMAAASIAQNTFDEIDVHRVCDQFVRRHDLSLQPHDAGLPAQSTGAVLSGNGRDPGVAGLHLVGCSGIPDRGEAAGDLTGTSERVARHGELFPLPPAVHPVDGLFQVRTFRRERNRNNRLIAGSYGETNHD